MANEWKPFQIAAAGEIQALADSAAALADTVKETLTLANLGMSAVKILAQLQTINPLLIALDALADEILKEIALFKEAGYYYLMIDPYYIKNVTPEPAFTYGFEQLRNKAGVRLWLEIDKQPPPLGTGEYVQTTNQPTQAQLDSEDFKPFLATPRKLIPGGYNPYENSLVDPLASISPYPKFSTTQVIEEFSKAFDDEGDVARFKALPYAPKKNGTIVYDRAGGAVSGWTRTKDFGIQLYDVGIPNQKEDYTVERKPINSVLQGGRPIMSESAAIAIILAAPSFDVFTDIFNAFSKMFSDIPDFTAVSKSMFDSFAEILTLNNVVIKLTQVDTIYGSFAEGDVIGGEKYGGLAEIVSIDESSIVATIMTAQKRVIRTDDLRNRHEYIETVNINPNERWVDMEVTAKPIRSADGLNPFIPGDDVYEQEKRGDGGVGDDLFPNYVTKGKHTVTFPQPRRIYPKLAKVAMEKLEEAPDSTKPDFNGIQIQHLIPAWGDFFQILENFVKQLKGMISDSTAFIQDMIDMIKDIEKFLEDMVKLILEFLEFFSITLPSAGVYVLNIKSQDKGNDGLKQAITGATGLPEPPLAYAAGILFVGTDPLASELLATLLQLD